MAERREPLVGSDHRFNLDKARTWEGTRDPGEKLCRTHLGGWVLWTGAYRVVSEDQAVGWLIRNEHEVPHDAADTAAGLEI